jgi:hypothetical protein
MNYNNLNEREYFLHKLHSKLFGRTPDIKDYDCTEEEYMLALRTSIKLKVDIDILLNKIGKPGYGDITIQL